MCSRLLCALQYEEMASVGRRSWEEDYVLKQAFPALVPAFDPRPGRSNISQIQNFEVPPPGTCIRVHTLSCIYTRRMCVHRYGVCGAYMLCTQCVPPPMCVFCHRWGYTYIQYVQFGAAADVCLVFMYTHINM